MLSLAKEKLDARANVDWVQADILEFFDSSLGDISAVVSSYAVHHLIPEEKKELFRRIANALTPGGKGHSGT